LRRQATTSRLTPAGSSRGERLDPFALPLRFEAVDHTADARVRSVELHHERVVLRREFRGIKMAVNLPVSAYLGVAIRMEPPSDDTMGAVTIVLEHPDRELSLMLYRATDTIDILAEWRSWGRALRLPLLVAEADGELRQPFPHIGAVRVATPIARRRRRSSLAARRPSFPRRRKCGRSLVGAAVHHDEREIIARN
jgi:uncharacterized protein DUF6101